jgi:hypothetical protein
MRKLSGMVCWILAACGNSADAVKDFIPGTYVKFSQSEYSKAWDTLRISMYDATQETYGIRQHTGYQRIVKGKLQPKAYKSSKAVTVYDPSTHQLQDLKTGKWYTFSQDNGTLVAGSAEYTKIN